MTSGGTSLFQLAERRLRWLDQRQQVLAQNIANVDSPGYAARDLRPFAAELTRHIDPNLARTQPGHLSGARPANGAQVQRDRVETTLDGNRVSLDDQLMKVSDTESHQGLTSSLYRKYLGLFRTALGRTG